MIDFQARQAARALHSRVSMRFQTACLMILFASCSPGQTTDPGTGSLTVFPTQLFVGVDDAGHGFLAPLTVSGATGITWSTTSMDFTVSGDDHGAMVTGMIAGGGDIDVRSADGQTTTVSVRVRM